MDVELRFFSTVRDAVGERRTTRTFGSDATVQDVLAALEAEYPGLDGVLLDDRGGIAHGVTVIRNGIPVTRRDGARTPLADGDRLSIAPPITGG